MKPTLHHHETCLSQQSPQRKSNCAVKWDMVGIFPLVITGLYKRRFISVSILFWLLAWQLFLQVGKK
jgi:hypothetical protein